MRQPFAIGGSGSTYLYGHVDSVFKEKMTKDQCAKFCINGKNETVQCCDIIVVVLLMSVTVAQQATVPYVIM